MDKKQIQNAKLHVLRARTEPSKEVQQVLSPQEIEHTPQLTFLEKRDYLRDITGNNSEEIIFDSNTAGFDGRDFASLVCGKSKICVMVFHKNGVFGYYQEDALSLQKADKATKSTSGKVFLFGLRENQTVVIKRRAGERTGMSIPSSSEKDMLFIVTSAFWMKTDGKVTFNNYMRNAFNFSCQENPLTGRSFFENIICERLLVLGYREE
ncbi:hypothetical protein EIN_186300 [Entamoeba invadens IP1]|uniref:hypothetical protein n=1 Tax=Entamoeba invadens IP1 TaxID=370355 RepID=UPI0002C3E135|nr:hypothetical protein EIN_186300 [Entamoeba invadens IP1]ELP94203.1 hypothetical protein EIN_186300 [Entamoeba invadens IP1]|eukprot:XP_004260974.1 hypothetical protein EIN_186300 [Entamoeba invadens IP1]